MADIIDLRGPEMAAAHSDYAWLPIPGTILQVAALRGVYDARIDLDMNGNNLHVVILKSYFGVPWAAWAGTHTPIPTDGVDGWVLDSNNPIESIQEYRRWWNTETGQAMIEFRFETVDDLLIKSAYNVNTIGGVPFADTEVPYKQRGADMDLRPSLNERIEIWRDDNSVGYTQADGSPIRTARMAIQFDRFPG